MVQTSMSFVQRGAEGTRVQRVHGLGDARDARVTMQLQKAVVEFMESLKLGSVGSSPSFRRVPCSLPC
ncbi:hypothetical protein CPB85DRAFT_1285996 [Mucidula mucida]|nr:hypothetical protein CPB85DRAFT_1285996 [Mucidula mucida]